MRALWHKGLAPRRRRTGAARKVRDTRSILRKLLVVLALVVLFSPVYPEVAAWIDGRLGADPELAAVQAEYGGIAPSVDQLQ